MPTSLAEALDTAMDKAVATHSTDLAKPAVASAPAEPSKETPKPAEHAEPAKPATEQPAAAPPDTAKEQPPEKEGSDDQQLLTKEEKEEIQKNPLLSKAYTLMQGTLTRKTQDLATQRKSIEQYQPLIESYQKDPKGTVELLARNLGLEFAQAPKPATEEQTKDALAVLTEKLGPDLAPILAQPFAEAMQAEIAKRLGDAVTPIQQFQEQLVMETAAKETATVMEAFGKAHPDYEKYQDKMVGIINQLEPKGMDQREYLESVYYLATKDVQKAESIKEVVKSLNDAAAKQESPQGGVAAERVSNAPPKFTNLNDAVDQALNAARRGERWGTS